MSAFASGTLTFTAAVGAVTMKLTAAPILRRWGFRRVLLANAWLSSGLIAALALFTASTPGPVIMAVLLVGGFFRSLQFTSLNTLGYADVPQQRLSRATALVAVAQQLSLAAGVAVAAMLLDASRLADGRASLLAIDFRHAFAAIGLLSLASIWWYRQLAADAGAEMSGHRRTTSTAQAAADD
jgi:MFS family permease